ncbi:MAG: bifunctional homocysteine S-methyltransferase/methylenetetrahydrofolate reductase [Firmicutes bacterium]|nr:bifunctional homocysteine S-methyltransferase/methylenetetrahydrofolate reductase [Bacillota bacterium]
MTINEKLKNGFLILDGAMGTYFSEQYPDFPYPCEYANLEMPEAVRSIHKEYIEAGAEVIKTNTFSANPVNEAFSGEQYAEVIRAGCRIAKEAAEEAGRETGILADLGPLTGTDGEYAAQIYRKMIDVFLSENVTDFLFETNSNCFGIREAAEYIRSRVPEAFVMVSFAVQTDGYSREGFYYLDLFREMTSSGLIDAVGLNCILSALHMNSLLQQAPVKRAAVCAMPNGGYPRVFGRRVVYEGDPGFFTEQMMKIAGAGVSVLGGCCGTTPAFIRELSQAVRSGKGAEAAPPKVRPAMKKAAGPESNRLWKKIEAGSKVIAVEFDTPKDSTGESFMAGAWQLKAAGVDAITLADCPTARARMDSSIMACKLRRELDIDTIPHLTCRDRNINATKALLLGLSMEGVNNVLLVTGDPIPSAERDEVKSVYQYNSRMLTRFVKSLNENELSVPFRIFGALNVNARNFQSQINMAKSKIENGAACLLTQPVLTEQALENLKRAREELECRILGGIIPVVSSRNARFMNSEISGIEVAEDIIRRYEGRDRAECTKLAVEISTDIARRMHPYVDGYYLVTPFSRVDIITEIVRNIREFA